MCPPCLTDCCELPGLRIKAALKDSSDASAEEDQNIYLFKWIYLESKERLGPKSYFFLYNSKKHGDICNTMAFACGDIQVRGHSF